MANTAMIRLSLFCAVFMLLLQGAAQGEQRPAFDVDGAIVLRQFGTLRGDYFLPKALVGEQLNMGLGIRDPAVMLPDGNYLVSGCRPHSCTEKAAIIASTSKQILAAGLIHFHCREVVDGMAKRTDCETGKPRLAVFVRAANKSPAILKDIQDWARRAGNVSATEIIAIP